MATSGLSSQEKHVRHWVYYQMELIFSTEADKKDFTQQLEQLKSTMLLKKLRSLDIHEFLDIIIML